MNSVRSEQPSAQFDALKARVLANLHVPYWPKDVQQYWIQRPQLIPAALCNGFMTRLVRKEEDAREVLEKFIWETPLHKDDWKPEHVLSAKKLVIWFLRQSSGLTEEIVLRAPYGIDEQSEAVMGSAEQFSYFVHNLKAVDAPIVDFDVVMHGVGCPLHLDSGSDERQALFFLTSKFYDARKARSLSWADATEAMKTIAPPE